MALPLVARVTGLLAVMLAGLLAVVLVVLVSLGGLRPPRTLAIGHHARTLPTLALMAAPLRVLAAEAAGKTRMHHRTTEARTTEATSAKAWPWKP